MRPPCTVTLPGIKAIGWIDCDKLMPHVALRGICKMDTPVLTKITWIDFTDAKCSNKTEYSNNGNKDTTTLKFESTTLIPIHLNFGFVVTDVNGQSYLIGSKEAVPKLESGCNCGFPGDESAGFEYNVTWITIKGLIPCII